MAIGPLSIVIATHRENTQGFLHKMARLYPKDDKIQYVIVDSGLTDGKVFASMRRPDFKVLELENSNRAERLAHGFAKSTGAMVLFNHPRSLVDPKALNFLATEGSSLLWGGLTHKFDRRSLGLRWTSWYSNRVRPRLWRVVYLDHAIFFQRHLLDQPIPPISIFEDTEISKILARHGRPSILPFVSETSAIRFEAHGFWKQALTNQRLKLAYHLGFSKTKMNQVYEKKLNLNE